MKWSVLVLSMVLLLGAESAVAKRLGGGKSLGRQSANVTQREAAPATPTPVPNQNVTRAPLMATPVAAPAQVPARRPWAGLLGGLAAGVGLVWLAHSMGLDESFGHVLLLVLMAMGLWWLLRLALNKRRNAPLRMAGAPFAMVGSDSVPLGAARAYRPENVGNDASARPFERTNHAPLDDGTADKCAAPVGAPWGVPDGFDVATFLSAAKTNFVELQGAWDRSDVPALRVMMTDAMLDEIRVQLAERESHIGTQPNNTEVIMLEARMLGIQELDDDYLASIEFSGLIREDASAGPSPFREVWNMSKTKRGQTGWLVAGVQALQ